MWLKLFLIGSVVFLVFAVFTPIVLVNAQSDQDIWKIYDTIEPTLDQVKWSETGTISSPASWIADGTWVVASMRQSLVSQNDIFVSLYERFDWLLVKSNAEEYYRMQFNSFDAFSRAILADAGPWLSLSWNLDTQWYGISQNTTKVVVSLDQTSGKVDLSIWFHILRVPEYLSGSDRLTDWLTGFDLTPVSIGNMKLWELYEDWSSSGTGYRLQFEAPANILSHNGKNYTCTIGVATSFVNKAFKVDQVIDINMPPETIAKEFSPQLLSVSLGNNVGSFVLQNGDLYPAAFTVLSEPPSENLAAQVLTAFLTTPAGLGAIASLTVLGVTGLRGRQIYRRNALYHRLYRSMVTLYDLYSKDQAKFRAEINDTSKTIFKMMVEDKITDEQFERLLTRRDDLLDRAQKEQLPPPPNL